MSPEFVCEVLAQNTPDNFLYLVKSALHHPFNISIAYVQIHIEEKGSSDFLKVFFTLRKIVILKTVH